VFRTGFESTVASLLVGNDQMGSFYSGRSQLLRQILNQRWRRVSSATEKTQGMLLMELEGLPTTRYTSKWRRTDYGRRH
jgi:hypothetical protein